VNGNKLRMVVVAVEGTKTHCSNDCTFMDHANVAVKDMGCRLFNRNLVWDKRKKQNGYKRLAACKEQESKLL
jgi:hypothetical protein